VSELPEELPTTVVTPEVAAVAGLLRQLWPEMGEFQAQRHAATVVRINSKYYGPMDLTAAQKLVMRAPVVKPDEVHEDFCVEIPRLPGMFLRKWTAEMDKRPSPGRYDDPRWQPGGDIYQHQFKGGSLRCGSAKHGECTPCVKEGRLRRAIYRQSDANDNWSRSSLCGPCGRKLIGGPVVVPKFDTPEEAQAWLDANSD